MDRCVVHAQLTLHGHKCRKGAGYGMGCRHWQTSWQLLAERFYGEVDRAAWCYVEGSGGDGAWDHCVPEVPELRPNFVSELGACLPWRDVAADATARVELFRFDEVTCMYSPFLSDPEEKSKFVRVDSWYRPDGREWLAGEAPAGSGCALPAWSSWSGRHALEYRQQLRGADGELFIGPYCFVSTSAGPRPSRCVDPCTPKMCSRHGECVPFINAMGEPEGRCECMRSWRGPDCAEPYDAATNASRGTTCQEVRELGVDDSGTTLTLLPAFALRAYGAAIGPMFSLFGYQAGLFEDSESPFVSTELLLGAPTFGHIGPLWFVWLCMIGVWLPLCALTTCALAACNSCILMEECVKDNKGFVLLLLIAVWFLLPFLLLLLGGLVVALCFPVLAFKKVFHMERALAFCIGPVGVNTFALGFLGLGGAVAGLLVAVGAMKPLLKAKELLERRAQADWLLEASNVYSDWASLAALQSTGSALTLDRFLGAPALTFNRLMLASCVASSLALAACVVLLASPLGAGLRAPPAWILKHRQRLGADGKLLLACGAVVALQALADTVQLLIPLAIPFLSATPYLPDFTVYSALLSAYGIFAKAKTLLGGGAAGPEPRYLDIEGKSGDERYQGFKGKSEEDEEDEEDEEEEELFAVGEELREKLAHCVKLAGIGCLGLVGVGLFGALIAVCISCTISPEACGGPA